MASDRSKYQVDFGFVKDKLNLFFNRRSIQRTLNLIGEVGITGWEKWWQVEFAGWLSTNDNIGDWVMEEEFLTDLRRKTKKNSIVIDLGFRIKGFSTKEMLFLELKQKSDWKHCIDSMLTDVDKVRTAQKYSVSHLKVRNFFVVGVYLTGDTTTKDVHDYIERRGGELPIDLVFTKNIQKSPFSVTAF